MSRAVEFVRNGLRFARQAIQPGTAGDRAGARLHIKRRLALEFLSRFQSEMTFRRNGFVWTGPVGCTITRAIYLDGRHQDTYIDSLSAWILPGRPYVVNVGANIGDTALPLSRTGRKVLAIEPSPETFARLQNNVRQNAMESKVICCQVAISSTEGTAEMVIAEQPGNSEILGEGGSVGFDGIDRRRQVISVPTRPLVDVMASFGIAPDQVGLVWSDTQGFESHVIESGAEVWASGTPLWVEVWPPGLACHGGTDKFVRVCQEHFRRFVPADRFRETPEPIASFGAFVAGMEQGGLISDVLLIPG